MNNKYVAVDSRLSEKCCKYLQHNGYTLIKIPCIAYLDAPISAHPDMSLFKSSDKLFISSDIAHLFVNCVDMILLNREHKDEKLLKYPYDVQFNCVQVGNKLICNENYIHNGIKKFAKLHGIDIINVKQGYSKCSVCVVSDNAIITEDNGIFDTCNKSGIDVLLLKTRSVKLNGYNYGFIGGCSGKLSNGTIVFAGCIESHPEYKTIYEFCKKYGVVPVSMSDEDLYDVGSIIEL